MSCSSLLQALDVRECVCEYGANVLSLVQNSRPLRERVASAPSGAGVAGGGGGSGAVQAGRSAKELLMTLPCPSAQTVSKYNSQYHKLFQCVPKDEILMKGTVFFTLFGSSCSSIVIEVSQLSNHQNEKD